MTKILGTANRQIAVDDTVYDIDLIPPNTPIDTDDIDKQIEVIVSIACGAELGLLDDKYVDEDIKRMNATIRANKDRLIKPIKALIANQVREARIDELELAVKNFKWGDGTDYLTDRIEALKGDDK